MRRRFTVAMATITMAALVGFVVAPAAGASGAAPASAPARPGHAATALALPPAGALEADFIGRINGLRAARGLPTLAVHGELTAASRSWAGVMADQGRIFHASDLSTGVTAPWRKLGENVGKGPEIGRLFQAFVDSPSHLENLVDPTYTHVGVGVVVRGELIFTTHRFMVLAPDQPPPPPPTTEAPAPPPTVPPTTAAPTTTAPPTTTTTTTTTTAPPEDPSKFGDLSRIRDLVTGD